MWHRVIEQASIITKVLTYRGAKRYTESVQALHSIVDHSQTVTGHICMGEQNGVYTHTATQPVGSAGTVPMFCACARMKTIRIQRESTLVHYEPGHFR